MLSPVTSSAGFDFSQVIDRLKKINFPLLLLAEDTNTRPGRVCLAILNHAHRAEAPGLHGGSFNFFSSNSRAPDGAIRRRSSGGVPHDREAPGQYLPA